MQILKTIYCLQLANPISNLTKAKIYIRENFLFYIYTMSKTHVVHGKQTVRSLLRNKPLKKITMKTVANVVTKKIRKDTKAKEMRIHPSANLFTNNLIPLTFSVNDITGLTKGDDIDQRLSNVVIVNYLWIKASFANFSTTKSKIMRVMVVRERNTGGVVLDTTNWTNLYSGNTFQNRLADGLSGDITYPLNRSVVDILLDKNVVVNKLSRNTVTFDKKLKINRKVEWVRDTAGLTPSSGRMYLIFHLCEPDNVTSSIVTHVDSQVRLFFKDA